VQWIDAMNVRTKINSPTTGETNVSSPLRTAKTKLFLPITISMMREIMFATSVKTDFILTKCPLNVLAAVKKLKDAVHATKTKIFTSLTVTNAAEDKCQNLISKFAFQNSLIVQMQI